MLNETEVPVYELATFETPVPTETIRPIVWSVQKYKVAQMMALEGKTKRQIAEEVRVPIGTIENWACHPDFKAYTKSLIEQAAATMKNESISLLTKVVSARVAQAEKSGDYSNLSRKDTLDIIRELNELTEADNKREESQYARLLERLVVTSVAKNTVVGGEE